MCFHQNAQLFCLQEKTLKAKHTLIHAGLMCVLQHNEIYILTTSSNINILGNTFGQQLWRLRNSNINNIPLSYKTFFSDL